MFSSLVFTTLTEIPIRCAYKLPNAVNHPTVPNTIILATDWEEVHTAQGIYEYNLETNESCLIHKYKEEFNLEFHGQCIDPTKNLLYLFGRRNIFSVFNLTSKKMKHYQNISIVWKNHLYQYPSCSYIPAPFNEIHILSFNTHHIFKTKCESFTKCQHNISFNSAKLVYIPSKQQLMIFGATKNDRIYSYDMQQYEWKQYGVTMPYCISGQDYQTLLGFENVLFAFYSKPNGNYEIYLFDLLSNKWFKSKYFMPKEVLACYHFVKNNNNAHFLELSKKKHFKVCLYDLIPNELVISHRKYYKDLIMG
eukprot:96221_1